ncbi:hypothetical protein BHM03_00059046 [Ensete ventricosum]|nr:hypothetical protein BHM03_00059046 [Ensete ventricosum]
MHPLRLSNSGIRAKVFMRKIGFKLRVMRLNRVECFYAFVLHFRSEGSEEEGRPATARASPQGQRLRARRATASPAASRGGDVVGRRGGCPLARRLRVGQGRRRLRRGSGDGAEGEKGKLGFPFVKRTILPH